MSFAARLLACAASLLLFTAAGWGVGQLLGTLRRRGLAARLAFSYLLGAGVSGTLFWAASQLFSIPLRRPLALAIPLALAASGIAARLVRRSDPGVNTAPTAPPPDPVARALEIGTVAVAVLVFAGLLGESLGNGVRDFDGQMTWMSAERTIRAEGTVLPRALTEGRWYMVHPQYPVLAPLAHVLAREALALPEDDRATRALYAAFYPVFLALLYRFARRLAGRRSAALVTLAAAVTPLLFGTEDWGTAASTYSDLPLACFWGAGFLLLLTTRDRAEAVEAGLLLAPAVLVKSEGLHLAAIALGIAGVRALATVRERPRLAARVALAALPFLCAVALLHAWRARIPNRFTEDYLEDFSVRAMLGGWIDRMHLLIPAITREMAFVGFWGFFWVAAPLVFLMGRRAFRRRAAFDMAAAMALGLGVIFVAYAVTSWPGAEQVHPTWNRFLLQLGLPLFCLLAMALRRTPDLARRPRPSDAPQATSAAKWRKEPAALLAFAALTVAMTWPWARQLRGSVPDEQGPYLGAYRLWWSFHQALSDPAHLFDATLFYPWTHTLAFGEHDFGLSLPFFPLFALGAAPLLVNNLATLLGIALSGYGAFRLARTLTGSAAAGWIAGLGFAFTPYRFHLLGNVTAVSAGWMALAFESVVLFARRPTRGRAAWMAAALTLSSLASLQWSVLSLPLLLAAALFFFARHGLLRDAAALRRAAAAAAVAAALTLPFVYPYRAAEKRQWMKPDEDEAYLHSARPVHWLTSDTRHQLHRNLGDPLAPEELCLFPGFLLLLLPFGLAARAGPRKAEVLAVGGLLAVAGFAGSLGMHTPLHAFLLRTVPLLQPLRVPARWAMLGHLGLALMAGTGAACLAAVLARRGPRLERGIAAAVAVLLLLELRAAPLALVPGAPDADAVTQRLRSTPMRGAIVHIPAGGDRGNHLYVLRAADHGRPLITAAADFVPQQVRHLEELSQRRPVPAELLGWLESIPTSYLVVRERWMTNAERGGLHAFLVTALRDGRLRFLERFPPLADDLYAVVRTEPRAGRGTSPPWLAPGLSGPPDNALSGSLDEPAEGAEVQGELLVRGWAGDRSETYGVLLLIDGETRRPTHFARRPRPDVCAVIPSLGDCTRLGYEARFAFQPDDERRHEITAIFRAADGRHRLYPGRHFRWRP